MIVTHSDYDFSATINWLGMSDLIASLGSGLNVLKKVLPTLLMLHRYIA